MATKLEDTLTLEDIKIPGYERVLKVTDDSVGLKAVISIHNLRLCKAAVGGTRIYPYASFDDALYDVLRLSKGMTYKSAVSGSGWGGAKSVIIADDRRVREDMLSAFADAVNLLEGLYICAEDVGCTIDDVATIAKRTPYVLGCPHEKSSGNPAPFTAWGVFRGIQAACKKCFGTDSLQGLTVAVQGVGEVGERLAAHLFWHGAKLIITDLNKNKAERLARCYGGIAVAPHEIYEQICDVFSPCAMGGVLNPVTIGKLRCQIVAGAANNSLLSEEDAEEIMKRNILYAPDFVINAGGLINVTEETMEHGYQPICARDKTDKIYDQLMLIFEIASQNQISPHMSAKKLAEYRLQYQVGRRVDPIYLHHAGVSY